MQGAMMCERDYFIFDVLSKKTGQKKKKKQDRRKKAMME